MEGFEGLYNFYNIGATSSAEPMGAIKNGLRYARDGKGASQATKDKYLIPWNNKERAITGGGIFIGSSYIHLGQDTIYLQKFHVKSNSGGELFWHQYMTNVLAPYSEAKIIYNGYSKSNMLDNSMSFLIPVYNNMPEVPVESPDILESDYVADNTKVYADVTDSLNIRTGPSTSYELLTKVDRNVVMTRLARGRQAGERWDKVQLPNGMIGYAFQSYLKPVPEKQIESIKAWVENPVITRGETRQVQIEILPEEAKDHEVVYQSSNPRVATVDNKGNILALKSGTTTITVKAKENDVTSQVEVQVYVPVTDILLSKERVVLPKGESYSLEATVLPEDATNPKIDYQSQAEEIASIDASGRITANEIGNTKIVVSAEETITKEVEVIVVETLAENEILFDSSLKVEQNEITGWDLNHKTVQDVRDKITTLYTIEVYDYEQNQLKDNQEIGTGSLIRILDEEGNIKMEYDILLYGDVTGEGKINSIDLLVLQRHILELEKLQGVFLKAGDVQRRGKNPGAVELLLIQRHILELEEIKQ